MKLILTCSSGTSHPPQAPKMGCFGQDVLLEHHVTTPAQLSLQDQGDGG